MSGCLLSWIKTWLLQNVMGFKWFKSPLRISDSQVVSKNIHWQTCSACQNLYLNLLTLRLMETCYNSRKYAFPASLNRHLTPDMTFFPSRTSSCFLFFALGVFFFGRCGACLVPSSSFPSVFTLFSLVSSFCVSCQYRAADWERKINSVQLAAETLRRGQVLSYLFTGAPPRQSCSPALAAWC